VLLDDHFVLKGIIAELIKRHELELVEEAEMECIWISLKISRS